VVFERAYVQVALCMPSRTSILTGRRPDTSRSWTIENDMWFRRSDTGANWTSFPGAFKDAGYFTMGMGKIFHEGTPKEDPQDAHVSWSPEAFYTDGGWKSKVGGLYNPPDPGASLGGRGTLAHGFAEEDEPALQDGNLTAHAVATIERMANGSYGADVASGARPFFLAIGYHKPHVPYWCPKRFWDLYPIEAVPPVPHPTLPIGAPAVSAQDSQMRNFCSRSSDIKPYCANMSDGNPMTRRFPLDGQAMSPEGAAYQRQAYFACVSYIDENIGRVLDAFEKTQFADNDWNGTVLVFLGDHGYHLGDNDIWEKMTNFEHATRIPLMIGCGGGDKCAGRSAALVEALDIMPTVLEEAGVVAPTPAGLPSAIACPDSAAASRKVGLCSEGRSLSALLRDPGSSRYSGESAAFGAAFSQFPRPEHAGHSPSDLAAVDLSCRDANLTACEGGFGWCNATGQCPNKMGYTVRTHKYRYTAWVGFNKCVGAACPALLADWSKVYARELYNHSDSPVPKDYNYETVNIVEFDSSAEVVAELHSLLMDFNTRRTMGSLIV